MKKIAIIGSGTSGMLCAHALQQKNYEVTVYSDRTADAWLHHSAPTGTAYLYDSTIQIEKNLGIDHWQENAFHGKGIFLDFMRTAGEKSLVMTGRFLSPFGAAIDIRLRVHRWMNDFETAGGKIEIGNVDLEGLNQISEANDLTLLAVGKGDVGKVAPRDPERSVYDKPQRNLLMVIVEGEDNVAGDRCDFIPVKFNFYADAGEYFWVPYTHKSGKRAWCVLWEAKPGQYLDRFGAVSSAEEAWDTTRQVIKEYAPFEYPFIKDLEPVAGDPLCWLKGRFPPTVRQACGRTESAGLVIPIGDTAMTFDPIGGQGGNCAQKNAWHWAEEIIARGDAPFTEAWAKEKWEDFWVRHGWASYTFNNILLEPLTEAGAMILEYAARDRAFADTAFIGNFHSPGNFFPWFDDLEAAKNKIAQYQRNL